MLIYTIYIFFIAFITINIYQIIFENKMNNNTLFLVLTNYILNIVTTLFIFYFENIYLSLISSFILMIFAFLLIRDIKQLFSRYMLYSLPYFVLSVYAFSYIVNEAILSLAL